MFIKIRLSKNVLTAINANVFVYVYSANNRQSSS